MFEKILKVVVFLVIFVPAAGLAYLSLHQPAQVPASAIRVPITPERIARGEFVFQHLADCDGCHSQRDFTRVDGPWSPAAEAPATPSPA